MPKSAHTCEYQCVLAALRQAREAAGLTQVEVADRLGVYASYVSKCESGERRVDVVELADFCRAYGISLTTFLKPARTARITQKYRESRTTLGSASPWGRGDLS